MVPHSDGSTDLLAPPQKGDSKVGQCWALQTTSGGGGGGGAEVLSHVSAHRSWPIKLGCDVVM